MSRDEKRELCYCEECGAVAFVAEIAWRECRAMVVEEGGIRECRGYLRPLTPTEDTSRE